MTLLRDTKRTVSEGLEVVLQMLDRYGVQRKWSRFDEGSMSTAISQYAEVRMKAS